MNCPTCQTKLAEGAKFCNECGSNVELSKCKKCDKLLKPDARFCQNCGEPVKTAAAQPLATGQTPAVKQSWLNSFGSFLFIPVFAGIIVLLFWVNKEPEPLGASNGSGQEQAVPDMAVMEEVHQEIARLEAKLKKNPKDLATIDTLVSMYSVPGNYKKVAEFYENYLTLVPDDVRIMANLGFIYHSRLDRTDDANSLVQKALEREPTNDLGLFVTAEIQSSLHNHEIAESYWKKIIELYPNTDIAKVAQQRIHETMHEDEIN